VAEGVLFPPPRWFVHTQGVPPRGDHPSNTGGGEKLFSCTDAPACGKKKGGAAQEGVTMHTTSRDNKPPPNKLRREKKAPGEKKGGALSPIN